jgi:hypothetical protein
MSVGLCQMPRASLVRHAARQTASLWLADLFWAQMPLLVSHA